MAALETTHIRQMGAPVVLLTPGLPSNRRVMAAAEAERPPTIIAAPIVVTAAATPAPIDTPATEMKQAVEQAPTNAASLSTPANPVQASGGTRAPKAVAKQPAVVTTRPDPPRRAERATRVAQRERDDPPMRLGRGGNSDGELRSAPSRATASSSNWRQEVFSGR